MTWMTTMAFVIQGVCVVALLLIAIDATFTLRDVGGDAKSV